MNLTSRTMTIEDAAGLLGTAVVLLDDAHIAAFPRACSVWPSLYDLVALGDPWARSAVHVGDVMWRRLLAVEHECLVAMRGRRVGPRKVQESAFANGPQTRLYYRSRIYTLLGDGLLVRPDRPAPSVK